MKNPAEKSQLRIEIDTHQCRLSPGELARFREDLEEFAVQVGNFPVADFHLLIEGNARSNDYSVKVTLILPGETLVGNDHDQAAHAAFVRCLQGLAENVRAYKDRLGNVPEVQKHGKGTHQNLAPTIDPDPAAVEGAVRAGDYAAFRAATLGYEEPVRKRAGRWVERYPDMQARLDAGRLDVQDLMESVFLSAFEGYDRRPKEVRFGDWLESLIDPAVKALQAHPDEELQNVSLARSARDAAQGPGAT